MISLRLLGISLTIQPSFWIMNALWGYLLSGAVQGDRRGVLIFIVVWILCVLVSTLVHEFGHVLVARIFGQPAAIVLGGMGGEGIHFYEALRPWQRICVSLAGPAAGFLLLATLVVLDSTWYDWIMDALNWDSWKLRMGLMDSIVPGLRNESILYQLVAAILFWMTLITNCLNLLPIIPMDGGNVFREICCMVSPRAGLPFAFGVSFVLAFLVTAYHVVVLLQLYHVVTLPVQLFHFAFPEVSFIIFAIMTYKSYLAMRQTGAASRHALYHQRDD